MEHQGGDDLEDDFVINELVALSDDGTDEGHGHDQPESYFSDDAVVERGDAIPDPVNIAKKRKRREKEKERKLKVCDSNSRQSHNPKL